MDRLTFEGNFCDIAKCSEAVCPCGGLCTQKKVWERLKYYEDADQDGQIVVLPCRVGDTVYVINRHLSRVFDCTVISIHVGRGSDLKNYVKTKWVGPKGNESIRKWSLRQFGRYVFLTREEADAALSGNPTQQTIPQEAPEWKQRVLRTFLGGSRSE